MGNHHSGPRFGGELKRCHHHCLLHTRDCCACADTRPVLASGMYSFYVDGKGWTGTARREAGYCMECKDSARRAALGPASRRDPDETCDPDESDALGVGIEAFRNVRPKSCLHECALWTDKCCVCSDLRPFEPGKKYEGYVDGRTHGLIAEREDGYCFHCKRAVKSGALVITATGAGVVSPVAGNGSARHTTSPAAGSGRGGAGAASGGAALKETVVPARWVKGPDGVTWLKQAQTLITPPAAAFASSAVPRYPAYFDTSPYLASSSTTSSAATAPPAADAATAAAVRGGTTPESYRSPAASAAAADVEQLACPICSSTDLFAAASTGAFSAYCRNCSSAFPQGLFPAAALRRLPQLSEENAAQAVARIRELRREASSVRADLVRAAGAAGCADPAPAATATVTAAAVAFGISTLDAPTPLPPGPPPGCALSRAVSTGANGRIVRSADRAVAETLEQLCCAVCMDGFADPVTLPACGHSFCRACVRQIAARGGIAPQTDAISCPVCRTVSVKAAAIPVSTELAFALAALRQLQGIVAAAGCSRG